MKLSNERLNEISKSAMAFATGQDAKAFARLGYLTYLYCVAGLDISFDWNEEEQFVLNVEGNEYSGHLATVMNEAFIEEMLNIAEVIE